MYVDVTYFGVTLAPGGCVLLDLTLVFHDCSGAGSCLRRILYLILSLSRSSK